MVVKVMLLSVAIMAIAFVGLAVKILFKKGGKFPNTHISGNKYLRAKGVTCIQTYDKMEQSKGKKILRFKGLTLGHSGDSPKNLFVYR
jgi:hypothetical protein